MISWKACPIDQAEQNTSYQTWIKFLCCRFPKHQHTLSFNNIQPSLTASCKDFSDLRRKHIQIYCPLSCNPSGGACELSHSAVFSSLWPPCMVAHPAPLPMGCFRRDLPEPGIERESPSLAGGFFTSEPSSLPQKEQYMGFVYAGCWDTFSSLHFSQQSLLAVTLNLKDKSFVTKLQTIRGFFFSFLFFFCIIILVLVISWHYKSIAKIIVLLYLVISCIQDQRKNTIELITYIFMKPAH